VDFLFKFKTLLRNFFVVSSLLITVWLNGCVPQNTKPSPTSTQPPVEKVAAAAKHAAILAAINSYSLKGKLGVVTQKQGFSGNIDWQHQTATDNIDVFSPLGGKIANISKTAEGVTLTDQKGNTIKAQDAESLTEATLGFKLPLNGLGDWAIGLPNRSKKYESATWDELGRLLTLKQDGWDIYYDNYADHNGVDLPNKIVLKSEKVNLKLLIETWQ
jgi:outer membrane lipoprotein LolB